MSSLPKELDEISQISEPPSGAQQNWGKWLVKQELVVAALLFVASNIFVFVLSRMAHWELDLTRGHKLAAEQLERCLDGNSGTPTEACQFDCCLYSSIIRSGYDSVPHFGIGDRANWNFFPLFPLTAVPWFKSTSRESTHAIVLAGKFELYFAILAFLFLVRSKSEGLGDTVLAASLVAFNPAIIYAHGGYAEPLYFTLAAMGLWFLDRQRWVGAGIAGGLLSATRMVGIVFCIAYAIAALRTSAVVRSLRERKTAVLVGALLCPVGLSLYLLYMYRHTGDALAPVHIYVSFGLSSGNPVSILWESLRSPGWFRFWACLAFFGWGISAWLMKQGQYEKAAFLALAILIPITAEVAGMQRFVWWQPPMLYGIFLLLKRYPRWKPVYFAASGGMASVMVLYWFLGGRSVV